MPKRNRDIQNTKFKKDDQVIIEKSCKGWIEAVYVHPGQPTRYKVYVQNGHAPVYREEQLELFVCDCESCNAKRTKDHA